MKKVLIIMLFIFPLVVNAKGIKVDGVTYLTPSEAEEAIKDGSTVVLEEDFVDEDTNSWQNINIIHSNVTIDLNNHKINSIYMIPPVPESQNNTSAVIKNGTIENNYGSTISNRGHMVLQNVTVNSVCAVVNCSSQQIDSSKYIEFQNCVINTDEKLYNFKNSEMIFTNTTFSIHPTIVTNMGTLTVDGETKDQGDVVVSTEAPVTPPREYVKYDWNDDGTFDIKDVILYRKYLAGAEAKVNNKSYADFEEAHKKALNADNDLVISLADLVNARINVNE